MREMERNINPSKRKLQLKNKEERKMVKKLMIGIGILMVAIAIVTELKVYASSLDTVQAVGEEGAVEEIAKTNNGIGLIAAALAIGLSAIGSGIAVAVVASSAVGAISENPNLLGKTVIFAGLAEGIAIYGLIIAIMILSKI